MECSSRRRRETTTALKKGLAHDNILLEKAEARFIFDSISAVLRFVKSIDASRFES
jgi:hypothetical protein